MDNEIFKLGGHAIDKILERLPTIYVAGLTFCSIFVGFYLVIEVTSPPENIIKKSFMWICLITFFCFASGLVMYFLCSVYYSLRERIKGEEP